MRMRRMVAEGVGYYHVISRITGQQFLVGDEEKENSEKVASELAGGGKLSLFTMLRCKVRYFSHGLAVGPAAFVREVIGKLTPTKDTTSRCDCCDEIELFTARRLRGDGKVSVPRGRVA